MEFLPAWPFSVNTLFFFGFLLFSGALGGYFAHRWRWLPSITGFMVVGFVAGPNVLGVIGEAALAQSRIVVDVALALILYRLGLSIDTKRIKQDRQVLLVSLAESALTFAAVYFGLALVGVSGLTAAVISTIAISSSPAVLIHVAHELDASGPVTERAMLLVALNNVIAFIAFAAVLPALYGEAKAPLAVMVGAPLYQVVGSGALGLAMGGLLHLAARKTKVAEQYQLALVIGAVMMTVGAALAFKLSALFAPLVLGMVVRSMERAKLIASIHFGPAFELFFIVLFVYAGANLHVAEIVDYWPAVLMFLGARAAAKWLGVGGSALLLGATPRQAGSTGLLLLPMAGLAIGLVNTTLSLFPEKGAAIGSIVLAAVALLETIGPPIAVRALRWSGDQLNDQAAERASRTAPTAPSNQAPTAAPPRLQPPAAPEA
ncbi:MAG: cation:proton antiporter [Burkholderiaceae bacterium]|jgi:Kef-type K+ transport system membrane component KefB|nr:cation:proton antiporter [Burkholderiaceae bacterium]MCO5103316.1 cation:proton antiporter [Burkholderiaceae bacterium]MCO5109243.1 cation:proton antiporter [Burkholderiaceae bacterium]